METVMKPRTIIYVLPMYYTQYKYNGYGINQFLSLAGLIGSLSMTRAIICNFTVVKKVWDSKPRVFHFLLLFFDFNELWFWGA